MCLLGSAPRKTPQEYSVSACAPGHLSDAELATCADIVRDGGAVTISLEKLQNARTLAVARKSGAIVGVGSIKRDRPDRAVDIARDSAFDFPKETPELGYVRSLRSTADEGFLACLSVPCSSPCPAVSLRRPTMNT